MTATETIKARNVKLVEGQVVNIRFADGTVLSLSDAMLQAGKPVVKAQKAEPIAEATPVRRGRKAKADKPAASPAPQQTAAPAPAPAKSDKPSLKDRKSNSKKRTEESEFKGFAYYLTKDRQTGESEFKEVAIIWVGKHGPDTLPALRLAYPKWDEETNSYYVEGTGFMVSQYHKKDGEFVLDANGERTANPKLRDACYE